MKTFDVQPVSGAFIVKLTEKIDGKTKPPGSLGVLEDLAVQIGNIQATDVPRITKPAVVVFAGDHGVSNEGVSPYPREVTGQMVLNFLGGGAAISVFARHNDLDLVVVDAGVDADLAEAGKSASKGRARFIDAKVGRGTRNFLKEDALSEEDLDECFGRAEKIVDDLHQGGCNLIGFGEMGIGNTSSAAMLQTMLTNVPLSRCAGRGTGLDDQGLSRKIELLEQARRRFKGPITADRVLRAFGGYEVAMLVGAILAAAERRMVILVDGYIATAALLVAFFMATDVLDYCIFAHESEERGHRYLLEFLQATPLLRFNLRLGEGTGAALAYPLVRSAIDFLNDMSSFADAGVSDRED